MKTTIKGLMMVGVWATMVAFVPASPGNTSAIKEHSGAATVDNTRSVPVTVYLDQYGNPSTRVRLGKVAPRSEATLALPTYLMNGDEIGITVHPAHDEDLGVQDLTFHKGKNLDVYVPKTNDGYPPPPPPATIPNPGTGTTTVTVENPRNQDLMVFMQYGPFETRLGVAPADRETTLVIPPGLALDGPAIRVFLTPKDGVDLETSSYALERGDHFLVRVPTEE